MTNHPWVNLVTRWLVLALGVALSAAIVPGIECKDGLTLLVVVLLLSVFNAILKPLLVFFTLPFVLLTMGVGLWFINAFLFLAVAKLVEGFQVRDFWSALGGALIVSATNILLTRIRIIRLLPKSGPPRKPDDVIDI